jgi:hypothetical protein
MPCFRLVHAKLDEKRCEEARKCLKHRPRPEDWRDIYFNDEFHVSSGASGRAWILRKPGERFCLDSIVEEPVKDEDRLITEIISSMVSSSCGWEKAVLVFLRRTDIVVMGRGKTTSSGQGIVSTALNQTGLILRWHGSYLSQSSNRGYA